MSGGVSPCKGCGKRRSGCHGTCEAYQEWAKKRREELSKINRRRSDAYRNMYSHAREVGLMKKFKRQKQNSGRGHE